MPTPFGKGNEWWRYVLLLVYLGAIAACYFLLGSVLGLVGMIAACLIGEWFLKWHERKSGFSDEQLAHRRQILEAERQAILSEARSRTVGKET